MVPALRAQPQGDKILGLTARRSDLQGRQLLSVRDRIFDELEFKASSSKLHAWGPWNHRARGVQGLAHLAQFVAEGRCGSRFPRGRNLPPSWERVELRTPPNLVSRENRTSSPTTTTILSDGSTTTLDHKLELGHPQTRQSWSIHRHRRTLPNEALTTRFQSRLPTLTTATINTSI